MLLEKSTSGANDPATPNELTIPQSAVSGSRLPDKDKLSSQSQNPGNQEENEGDAGSDKGSICSLLADSESDVDQETDPFDGALTLKTQTKATKGDDVSRERDLRQTKNNLTKLQVKTLETAVSLFILKAIIDISQLSIFTYYKFYHNLF